MVKVIKIVAPHFVAGIIIDGAHGRYDYDDRIVLINKCPPILKYMKSWDPKRIIRYCNKKSWFFQIWGTIPDYEDKQG